MAITNGYATLDELKTMLSLELDDTLDTSIENAIEAVSRSIDLIKGTEYFTASRTKVLTAHFSNKVHVPPCVSITSVEIDESANRTYTTLTADTHFETEGSPIHTLHITPGSGKSFPVVRGGVKVTAEWGSTTLANCPENIKAACRLGASRIFKRKDAVFGVVGGGSVGSATVQTHLRQDVDFMMLLGHDTYAEVY